ncbi:MAG TPA: class II glutamine amidotransferase [Acidiferrobacter sp.]|nr:class II glutamine amidotransferase [Acidiferrobacter sp.]
MCELLGINASRVVDVGPWLCRFQPRGGETANNPDGWGLAYMRDGGFRLYKAPTPSAHSALFTTLCGVVRSSLVIGHVRHANHPRVNSIENTHPFMRICCGREWVFAHNGLVSELMTKPDTRLRAGCDPLGQTDSEYAFCYLLENIAAHVDIAAEGDLKAQADSFTPIVELVAAHGRFNFLISDGSYLIAYGHDHLHHLDFSSADTQAVALATVPLTTDNWVPFQPGELRVYRNGRLVLSRQTRLGEVHSLTDKRKARSVRAR